MARLEAVHPVLPARDVREAVRYYTERLGFRLVFQDNEQNPRYAAIARDDLELHIQWHDEADFDTVERLALRFVVDDVDQLYEEYRDKGVFQPGKTVHDTPWGTREFEFYDLNGNGLFFYRVL